MSSAGLGSTIKPIASRRQNLVSHFVGSHGVARPQIPIHRECPQWEILAVPVITEIEHAWKPCAGVPNLFPRTILHLVTQKKLNASRHTERIAHAGRHQPKKRPGGLRWRTWTPAGTSRIGIGKTRFSPAAVRILFRFQPRHRTTNVRQ